MGSSMRLGRLSQLLQRHVPIEVVKERYRIFLFYKDPPRIIGTLTRKEIQRWAAMMRRKGVPFEVYCEWTGARMIGLGEEPAPVSGRTIVSGRGR
jgi:hypothetical protein